MPGRPLNVVLNYWSRVIAVEQRLLSVMATSRTTASVQACTCAGIDLWLLVGTKRMLGRWVARLAEAVVSTAALTYKS